MFFYRRNIEFNKLFVMPNERNVSKLISKNIKEIIFKAFMPIENDLRINNIIFVRNNDIRIRI